MMTATPRRKRYEVLFDFVAEDTESELSVSKGEVVLESEDGEAADGWVLVDAEGGERNGFVPLSFLLPLQDEEKAPSPLPLPLEVRQLPPPAPEPVRRESSQLSASPSLVPKDIRGDMNLQVPSRSTSFAQLEALRLLTTPAKFADCAMAALVKAEKYDELLERQEHALDHIFEKRKDHINKRRDELIHKASDLLAGLDALHVDIQKYCGTLEQNEEDLNLFAAPSSWLLPTTTTSNDDQLGQYTSLPAQNGTVEHSVHENTSEE